MKTVFAHEHEGAEGGIQATLHINPIDHPVVGQEARFFFTFTDPDGKFEISRCDCQITLEKNGAELETKQIEAPEGKFAALGNYPLYTKTFSEAGDYELHMHGGPKNGATFDTFDLHFDVPVTATAEAHENTAMHHSTLTLHGAHFIIFGGGLIAAIVLFIYGIWEKKNNQKEHK